MKKTVAMLLALLLLFTLTPIAGLAAGGVTIDPDFVYDKGVTTIRWTDSDEAAPYLVGYMLYTEGSAAPQRSFLAYDTVENSATMDTSFALTRLIPGRQYVIGVIDGQNRESDLVISLPEAAPFVDGKLDAASVRVTVEPMFARSADSSLQGMEYFFADDLNAHMEERYYGIHYEVRLPELAYPRSYMMQIVMTAPNGYTETVFAAPYVFSAGSRFWYSVQCLGVDFFYNLYQLSGAVPTGAYTVELYLDGMLANTRQIKVY